MLRWLGLCPHRVLLVLLALRAVLGLLACFAAQSPKAALQLADSNLLSQVLQVAARQPWLVEMANERLNGIASGPYIKNATRDLCDGEGSSSNTRS
ncbi:hypothetical protein [Polaromonas sp.]|uniref:hypothetical protein n=1 Tax=Polaromonas sp. TaxID=1869339 RepID=UPI0035680013